MLGIPPSDVFAEEERIAEEYAAHDTVRVRGDDLEDLIDTAYSGVGISDLSAAEHALLARVKLALE